MERAKIKATGRPLCEQGFTMVEISVSLWIWLICLPIVWMVVQSMVIDWKQKTETEHRLSQYSLFAEQIQKEARMAMQFSIQGQELVYQLASGETIHLRLHRDRLIRSVQSQGSRTDRGTTILLEGVKEVAFTPQTNGVKMQIALETGNKPWIKTIILSGRISNERE
jgi:competence protein ComGF